MGCMINHVACNMTPEELKNKRLRILEETAKFYSLSNRAFSKTKNTCVYYDIETGNSCAVGRLIENKELALSLGTMPVNGIFKLLPENVQILGRSFLSALQRLHDRGNLWDINGLNSDGINYFNELKLYNECGIFDKEDSQFT